MRSFFPYILFFFFFPSRTLRLQGRYLIKLLSVVGWKVRPSEFENEDEGINTCLIPENMFRYVPSTATLGICNEDGTSVYS
jgi:hypothetical protein